MAAIVTGLIPILKTAVDTSTDYKGRTVWFGFLCIRLVSLFVAELPWSRLHLDFSCNATLPDLCIRACFNQHFDKPVIMAWNFLYVLLILSVLVMELFSSHLLNANRKKNKNCIEMGEPTSIKEEGRMVIDLHRGRGTMAFYLLSIVLRVVVEGWFVYILLFWNLPKLENGNIICRTATCPQLHLCVVRAVAEKRMSLYALVSISSLVIIANILFLLYSVAHYVFGWKAEGSTVI